jgi:CRP-like cAMP-binding protein
MTSSGMAFNAEAFLRSPGAAKKIRGYGRDETIFVQGDACDDLLYIQSGGVRISVPSTTGEETVVTMLGPGEFFGEGCLGGQPVRTGRATAITPSTILLIGKARMLRLLHVQRAMADRFISHMLSRNIGIEADLVDRLCGRPLPLKARARPRRKHAVRHGAEEHKP